MALLLDVLSFVLLSAGGFFVVVGSLGLVRMPDFFTRIHAASITDTLGAGLLLLGLLLQTTDPLGAVKLVLILAFLVLTGPTATHALAKSALHGGLSPDTGDDVRSAEGPSSTS
jgi:multicomponent Na+:H+ antiporter subunit G